jgi:hypothetical protein
VRFSFARSRDAVSLWLFLARVAREPPLQGTRCSKYQRVKRDRNQGTRDDQALSLSWEQSQYNPHLAEDE